MLKRKTRNINFSNIIFGNFELCEKLNVRICQAINHLIKDVAIYVVHNYIYTCCPNNAGFRRFQTKVYFQKDIFSGRCQDGIEMRHFLLKNKNNYYIDDFLIFVSKFSLKASYVLSVH